jgi:hypothetical protein
MTGLAAGVLVSVAWSGQARTQHQATQYRVDPSVLTNASPLTRDTRETRYRLTFSKRRDFLQRRDVCGERLSPPRAVRRAHVRCRPFIAALRIVI